MFRIIYWAIFGFIVGFVAKSLHPGDEKIAGCGGTILLGVVGSFTGGAVNYLVFGGDRLLSPSGFMMSVFGAIICCTLYVWANREGKSE